MQLQSKPLRETMLDVHQGWLKQLLQIPSYVHLAYDVSSSQIEADGTHLPKYLGERLFDQVYLSHLLDTRNQARSQLLRVQADCTSSSEMIFHAQFDYEMLALDHLVDEYFVNDISPNLLLPSSGRTFFEEVEIKELESFGHYLSQAQNRYHPYFENKGIFHFVKHTLTRYKLLDIMLGYQQVEQRLAQRYSKLPIIYSKFESAKDVYSHLQDRRKNQMICRSRFRSNLASVALEYQPYMNFVGEALSYNEDNRLLRSISFYQIMKNKTIASRFEQLIQERQLRDGSP